MVSRDQDTPAGTPNRPVIKCPTATRAYATGPHGVAWALSNGFFTTLLKRIGYYRRPANGFGAPVLAIPPIAEAL
jgi:hypothetical protein